MSKLTEQQIERLIAWREAGRSCAWIAGQLGVSAGAINYQCLKNGVVSPRQRGKTAYAGPTSFTGKDGRIFRRFTDEEDAELLRLSAETQRIDEIAELLGRPRSSVRMRLLLLGLHEEIAA